MARTEELAAKEPTAKRRSIRCAIYTRKSTNEGLDRDFNSLDAQRESAEAYVASQRSEGWTVLPQHYDDGGFTGANADRPALKQLLEDIHDGRVDCVVVYKVDRLSRSLLDFARLIETFERYEVALVSVTQSFNTATSMGRLTLNILLSFAQFERELISERTRDKMGAARRKGKWTGGRPPLGYRLPPGGGRLEIEPEEAKQARGIFDLYLKHRSILQVVEELGKQGCTTRARTSKDGQALGGRPFTVSNVRGMLTNATYAGKVRYEGQIYPGEHEAIIPEETFHKVEELLAANHWTVGGGKNHTRSGALLAGILRCRACSCGMTPANAKSGGRRYGYYVCVNAQKRGRSICPTKSVNGPAIERAAVKALRNLASDPERLAAIVTTESGPAGDQGRTLQQAMAVFGDNWELLFPAEQARVLRTAVSRAAYDRRTGALGLTFSGNGLQALAAEAAGEGSGNRLSSLVLLPETIQVEVATDLVQRPLDDQAAEPEPAPPRVTAVSALALAHRIEELVRTGQAKDYAAVARQLGLSRARVTQLSQLRFLGPAIQEEILAGRTDQSQAVTERQLRPISAEADWNRQLAMWHALGATLEAT